MLKKLFMALCLFACFYELRAQELGDTASGNPKSLNDVVVFSSKFAEKFKRIAQTVDVIKSKPQLNFQANTADVLMNSGKLCVQKSQQGGGSPVIRGFEASRRAEIKPQFTFPRKGIET
ncbi:MAG: hypothetical protein EAZ41_07805 [Sphingobacteriia bacterium]|nr:MAG: hypothetical protein EAZ41_07805 [Sphingobacteriia bacterium]